METALIILIIACIVLPLAAFLAGRHEQKATDETLIDHYKTEIARLQQSEDDLRQSLYHRIGFKPERKTTPADTPEVPAEEQPEERKPHGLPDIYRRRERAFAEDLESEKQRAARAA